MENQSIYGCQSLPVGQMFCSLTEYCLEKKYLVRVKYDLHNLSHFGNVSVDIVED